MKKILLLLMAVLVFAAGAAEAKYQRGYVRKNGTYVSGHFKTSSDGSKLNNYSTKGNRNPYTGKKGYKNPYKVKSYKMPKVYRRK